MEVIRQVVEDELKLQIPIAGLAKDGKHKTHEVLIGFPPQVVGLKPTDQLFKFFAGMQDEVHRFAITFNRDSRIKASKKNILEELPWIWPKTRAKLLKHYWSVSDIIFDDELKNILSKSQIETLQNHWII